jgi:Icc protein
MRVVHIEPEPFHTVTHFDGPTTHAPAAVLPFHRATVDVLPDVLRAIVATSDLQGVVQSVTGGGHQSLGQALAAELRSLRTRGLLPERAATAVLLAGDLHPGAGVADVSAVWHALADECRWVAGVAGNHDAFGAATALAAALAALGRLDCHLLDGDRLDVDGLRIGGLSGMVGSSGEPWARDKPQYATAVSRLVGSGTEVLICHDGPNVAGTSLSGWPVVRHALEAAPPTLLVRGHDHWPVPLATLANGTQVLNVEGRVVVMTR